MPGPHTMSLAPQTPDMNASHCCHEAPAGRIPPPGRRLIVVGGMFAVVLALSFLPILAPLNESLLGYLGIIWWAVLLGLAIGGLIDYFVPDGFMIRILGRHRKRTLL